MPKEGAPRNPGGTKDDREDDQPSNFNKLKHIFGPALEDEDDGVEITPEKPNDTAEPETPEGEFNREKLQEEFTASIENALKAADEKRNKGEDANKKTEDSKPKTALSSRLQKRIDRAKSRPSKAQTKTPDTASASVPATSEELEVKKTEEPIEVPVDVPVSATTSAPEAPEEKPKSPEVVSLGEARRMLDAPENEDPKILKEFIEKLETMQVTTRGGKIGPVPSSLKDTAKERLANLVGAEPAAAAPEVVAPEVTVPKPKEKLAAETQPTTESAQEDAPTDTSSANKPKAETTQKESLGQIRREKRLDDDERKKRDKENKDRGKITPRELSNLIDLHKRGGNINRLENILANIRGNKPWEGMSEGGKDIDPEPYAEKVEAAIQELIEKHRASRPQPKPKQKTEEPPRGPKAAGSATSVNAPAPEGKPAERAPKTEAQTGEPKNIDDIMFQIGSLESWNDLRDLKAEIKKFGFVDKNGALVKLEPGSPEESALFGDMNRRYEEMHPKARPVGKRERDDAHENDLRDQLRNRSEMEDVLKHVAASRRKKTSKHEALTPEQYTEPIAKLFNLPEPSSWEFQSMEQAVDEPGFNEFAVLYDAKNSTNIEKDWNDKNEAGIKERFDAFYNARKASQHVREVLKGELLKDFKGEIKLPKDAGDAIAAHFARLCLENPAEVSRINDLIKTFTELPEQIAAAEEKMRETIADDGGEEKFNTRVSENKERKRKAEELEAMLNGNEATGVKKAGYWERVGAAAKLISEGLITGRVGYSKERPFANLFFPETKIKDAITRLINDAEIESMHLNGTFSTLQRLESERDALYERYMHIKAEIISQIAPSKEVRKIINKTIQEKIESALKDDVADDDGAVAPKANMSELNKTQEFFEKTLKPLPGQLGFIGGELEYFGAEGREKAQKAIDAAFKKRISKDIKDVLKSLPATAPYSDLEKAFIKWLKASTPPGDKTIPKPGKEVRDLIVEAVKERLEILRENHQKTGLAAPERLNLTRLKENLESGKIFTTLAA